MGHKKAAQVMPTAMFSFSLPQWVEGLIQNGAGSYLTDESRMHLVIELTARNVKNGTGGPFGAAVFQETTGRVVGAGVNSVVASRCSHAHAEMVALAGAQQFLGSHDLSATGVRHELVSSCEPCAMCLGAVAWSGVTKLVCGARDEDARAIGFDEGPKFKDWFLPWRLEGSRS